jgi:WD40 repeat protein
LERITKLPHPASIGDFRFSPLGDELAVASRSRLEFWSTRTWQKTRTLTNFSRILYSPDAQTVWLNKDLRTAGLYEARTFKPLLMLPTGMLPLALSPDGNQVVVTVDTRRLQLWDLKALRAEMGKLALNW